MDFATMHFASGLAQVPAFLGSEPLQSVSRLAASTIVTSVWQSALIAGGLALALKLAPRSTASVRFALWGIAFGTAVVLPFLPSLMRSFEAGSQVNSGISAASGQMLSSHIWVIDIRWSVFIAFAWAAASIYRAADLARHALRLGKLWKTAKPIELGGFGLSNAVGAGSRRVEICTTALLDRPSVIGFFSPRILIPEWLYDRLTPIELDQVILHETEHLARRDDWTNLLQKLGLVLFPLNPALIWMDRQLSVEREMACDDGVIRRTHAPRAYATCLTNLAERGIRHRSEALSLGAWHRRPELARRIHSILLKKRGLSPAAATTLMVTLGSAVIAGSFELSRCPQLIAFEPKFEAVQANARLSEGLGDRVLSDRVSSDKVLSDRVYSNRAHAVQASFVEPATPGSGTSDSRMVSLKAVMPQPRNLRVNSNAGPIRRNEKLASSAKLAQANGIALPEGSGQAQEISFISAGEVDPANGRTETSGYIVLTTWEQTKIRPAQNQVYSDAADQETASMEGHFAAVQTGAKLAPATRDQETESSEQKAPMYETTITRLILRVIPEDSIRSSANGKVAARTGWLVFKL